MLHKPNFYVMPLVKVKTNPNKPPVNMSEKSANRLVKVDPDTYEIVQKPSAIKLVVKRPETVQKPEPVAQPAKKKESAAVKSKKK